ncbi:hypothetical protein [Streptomyces sp. R35]|uniref:Secreted protein n=1 Tax=Streptomyces sp. R35 TaxID=3238630 RepID=A0AB39SKU8_9ACTN
MTTAHRRVRAAMIVAAVLAAAGCSGGGGDDAASSPSATTTAAAPATTPSTASPTPAVKPSDIYPTNAAGCHPNAKWSTAKAVDWVDWGQVGTPALGPGEVRFPKSMPGFDGPLCDRVTVQVQYWRVNYRPSSATSAADPLSREVNYDYALRSLKRTELHIDGRKVHDVKPPKGFASAKASPCDGFLEAIYVGAPLKNRELPTKISTGNTIVGDDVTFPTKRVVDYHVFAPSAPQLCDDNGIPTASPAPSGYPSSGFGLSTPSYPAFDLTPKS